MYELKHFEYINYYEEVWHFQFRISNICVSTG
jgi:hypothetical protein